MTNYTAFLDQLGTRLNADTDDPVRGYSLAEWETYRDRNEPPLTQEEMQRVVDIAIAMLQGIYSHIDLKRARRGVNPLSQLRVLRERIEPNREQLSAREFHLRMLEIFKSLGDVHTAYRRPEPYRSAIAFLPFLIRPYFDEAQRRRFLVKQVLWKRGELGTERFAAGVDIITWNGTRMEEAVRRSADFEEGSNEPHDFALGLQFMTVRWLGASFEPDSETVTVGYQVPGDETLYQYQAPWSVFVRRGGPRLLVTEQARALIFDVSRPTQQADRALHVAHQEVHYWRRKLFVSADAEPEESPEKLGAAADELVALFGGFVGRTELAAFTNERASLLGVKKEKDVVPSLLPAYFEAGILEGTHLLDKASAPAAELEQAARGRIGSGAFGYIRIRAFALDGPEKAWFKYELRRLLNLMPSQGLIIDLRDNPGGSTRNAEESLQFLTPKTVTPLPFRFAASPQTRTLTRRAMFEEYLKSIDTALGTGSAFSAGRPITSPIFANALGQHYFGPVVLITSAMTYSAGDIFAAGFQDCKVGRVIGVDETTGAGGANCWFYEEEIKPMLESPGLPAPALPAGINMQIAVRQCTRVGALNSGVPVEEIGVPLETGQLYQLTKLDVLESRPWGLLLRAVQELVTDQRVCDLSTTLKAEPGQEALRAVVTTKGIDRLDLYLNGRPTAKDVNAAGVTTFPFPALGRTRLEIQGFSLMDGQPQLVARSVAVFNGSTELAKRTP